MGLYILHILGEKYRKHSKGLYRDNGLACFGYTSETQADRIRKDFIKIFKEGFDLRITWETILKAATFLDATLNLVNNNLTINQIIIHYISTSFLTIHQILLEIFQAIYLKEWTIYRQMKQHLIRLRIYITTHWPKVDLNITFPKNASAP